MASEDIVMAQGKYQPFRDIIDYLKGKACRSPKNLKKGEIKNCKYPKTASQKAWMLKYNVTLITKAL